MACHSIQAMKLPLVLACAALALVSAGCGSHSLPPQQIPGVSEQLVTPAALARYPASSPQHALLDWWRSAQFADPVAFLAAFTPPVRSRLAHRPAFGEELDYFAGSIRNAAPRILTTEIDGSRARIFTKIAYRTPIGTMHFVIYSRPQAFELVRHGDRWLLADDTLVASALRQRNP
jgi:hypothetical protein